MQNKSTTAKVEKIVKTEIFEEFHASVHQGFLGECKLTTNRKVIYLRGKNRNAFRHVSCSRFLRIVAGKEAWL